MSKHKIPCIRCLLRDLDQKAALKQVTAYRERLPVQQKSYKRAFLRKDFRFAVIAMWLQAWSMPKEAGYYVEASAYDKTKHCPLGTKIW